MAERLALTPAEVEMLRAWMSTEHRPSFGERYQAALMLAEGETILGIATELGISRNKVKRCRDSVVAAGIQALRSVRPGRGRKLGSGRSTRRSKQSKGRPTTPRRGDRGSFLAVFCGPGLNAVAVGSSEEGLPRGRKDARLDALLQGLVWLDDHYKNRRVPVSREDVWNIRRDWRNWMRRAPKDDALLLNLQLLAEIQPEENEEQVQTQLIRFLRKFSDSQVSVIVSEGARELADALAAEQSRHIEVVNTPEWGWRVYELLEQLPFWTWDTSAFGNPLTIFLNEPIRPFTVIVRIGRHPSGGPLIFAAFASGTATGRSTHHEAAASERYRRSQ